MDLKTEDSGFVLELDSKRDPKDELIKRLEKENAKLQLENASQKKQMRSMQDDSMAKEQLLISTNQDVFHKAAQITSLSKIIEGKEEVIAHLNEENLNLFTLLKNIENNLFDVEQVLELTDKKNKKLKVESRLKNNSIDIYRQEVELKNDKIISLRKYITELEIKFRRNKEQKWTHKLGKLFSKKDRSSVYEEQVQEKKKIIKLSRRKPKSFFRRIFQKTSRNVVAPFHL